MVAEPSAGQSHREFLTHPVFEEPRTDDQRPSVEEVDLRTVFGFVWDSRYTMAISAGVMLLLGILYLHVAQPVYMATMQVQSASSDNSSGLGMKLSSLANIAGISLGGPTQDTSPFQLYVQSLTSMQVANTLAQDQDLMRRLFPGDWNAATNSWQEPKSMAKTVINWIKTMLGGRVMDWRPPDGERLFQYLNMMGNLVVAGDPSAATMMMVVSTPDRDLSIDLLKALHRVADERQRQDAITSTTEAINYLTEQLKQTSAIDERSALIRSLLQQRLTRVSASTGEDFAAQVFDPAWSMTLPTSPKMGTTLLFSIVLGVLIGGLISVYRYLRPSRPRLSRSARRQALREHGSLA